MTERGYLHPFLDGSRFDYGVGEEIRTVRWSGITGVPMSQSNA